MVEYYKHLFGYLIKTEREKQNITYYQLKKQSKVAESVIKSIEQGSSNYTIESLIRVCEALGLGINIKQK